MFQKAALQGNAFAKAHQASVSPQHSVAGNDKEKGITVAGHTHGPSPFGRTYGPGHSPIGGRLSPFDMAKFPPHAELEARPLRSYWQVEMPELTLAVGGKLGASFTEQGRPSRHGKSTLVLRAQELDAGQGIALLFHIEQAPRHRLEHG